ncbi:MAG: hypothetical protein JW864_12025 [Spirochaetes bacterium]|nr:hypothetical protein [Spirochaetota bacterium]
MKKIFVILAFISLFYACGNDDSNESDNNFIINADNIKKFESPLIKGQYFTTTSGLHENVDYAIIYNGTINGTNYVGIACKQDPSLGSYNLKIYYEASSITSGTYTATVVDNGTRSSQSLVLTISLNSTNTTDDYNVYDIEVNGSIGHFTITAVEAGS